MIYYGYIFSNYEPRRLKQYWYIYICNLKYTFGNNTNNIQIQEKNQNEIYLLTNI